MKRLVLVLVYCCAAFTTMAQTTADFFINKKAGTITSYLWDFGTGIPFDYFL